jgi:outer membrane protein assembly factor BamB
VVNGGSLYVVAAKELLSLDTATGADRWTAPLGSAVSTPPKWTPEGLVVVLEPGEVVLVREADGSVAWRLTLEAPARHQAAVDAEVAYLSLENGVVIAVGLVDGSRRWERRLPGTLSEPASAPERVFVGSTDNFLYALESRTGKLAWKWRSGGDVIGAAADATGIVYFVSLDNILRAVNRGNGNQRWKKEVPSRPAIPPASLGGAVVVAGVAPLVTAFDGSSGATLGSYTAPSELQGPPLIDPALKPYRVAVVVITRAGRLIGLRPTAMLLNEPTVVPLRALPGRRLSRERLD